MDQDSFLSNYFRFVQNFSRYNFDIFWNSWWTILLSKKKNIRHFREIFSQNLKRLMVSLARKKITTNVKRKFVLKINQFCFTRHPSISTNLADLKLPRTKPQAMSGTEINILGLVLRWSHIFFFYWIKTASF